MDEPDRIELLLVMVMQASVVMTKVMTLGILEPADGGRLVVVLLRLAMQEVR